MTALQPSPFLESAKKFASGEDNPREFLERCIEKYNALEPSVGAFVCTNLDRARNAADQATARWRKSQPASLIDGMPIGVKDIIETWDMPTQMGSPIYEDWHSSRDAASVFALREAGAVIVGKTVTTEFASTEPRGTRNPWDPSRTPGGSSSGSAAAVATGMVSAALGTQVVGSIIRPSSYCGCFGYKPTFGAINRGGSHDYLSQSCTGTLASTLEDLWVVAREISSRVGGDPGFVGLKGPEQLPASRQPQRLGFIRTAGWPSVDEASRAEFEEVINSLSRTGIHVLNSSNLEELAALEPDLESAYALTREIQAYEQRWPLNGYREHDRLGLSQLMLDRLQKSETLGIADYEHMLAKRENIRQKYARLAERINAVITLSAPGIAPKGIRSSGDPQFAVPASLLGVPAVSLPVMQVHGMPLGLQVIGFSGSDASLFSVAAALFDLLRSSAVA
jgi:Asp-tRNA(Asn)/Glu-tRNA(Gln) amidotransferase A subunit family amidase